MIIGFDGSRAFSTLRTGTENYSYQLLESLAKIDRKNSYKVYIKPWVKVKEPFPKNFEFRKINWSRFWTQGGLALQIFKDELDLLFVPSHTIPIIRRPGLKTVVTVHDLGSEYLPQMHQLKQRLYLALMQRYQLKTASKIIAVSNATRQDLINKIGIKKEKIEVVYEGYDQEMYNVQSTMYKNDALVDSLKPYYLFVGTIQPRKNLERLIKAFAKIEDKNLVIAGGKGWLSDEIYNLPKKLGIDSRVEFLGYVPDKDLRALYGAAIALVFPSLFEGFGLPILEAQASGCPVITSKISSMPEVSGEGAILVNPYDVDDIVRGMESVKGKAEREKLVKNGFENVKRFSWDKCARETIEVLEGESLNDSRV